MTINTVTHQSCTKFDRKIDFLIHIMYVYFITFIIFTLCIYYVMYDIYITLKQLHIMYGNEILRKGNE